MDLGEIGYTVRTYWSDEAHIQFIWSDQYSQFAGR